MIRGTRALLRRHVVPNRHAPLIAVLAVFAGSRLAAYAAGVRFDARKLTDATQFVDSDLLRHHLLDSLWWLHGQPPLYNLYLGVVLKLFPHHAIGVFQASQIALGVVEAVALTLLLDRVGARRWVGAAIAALVVASPPLLLYEAMLFYDYPTLVLLTLSALALALLLERPTFWRASALFALCAALALTRTIFHPAWLLLVVGLVLLAAPSARRPALAAAVVPVAVVALVLVKNAVLFGSPSMSTWFGMGLARLVLHDAPRPALERLVASGDAERIVLVQPFSGLDAYRDVVRPHAPTGHPVLDERVKPGGPNFFNEDFIAVSRAYLDADLAVIRHRPGDVAVSVKRATQYFFQPAEISGAVTENKRALGAWESTFSTVVVGSTSHANRVGVVAVLLYLAVGLWGLVVLMRVARGRGGPEDWLLVYCWIAIVLVGVGGNLTEAGENYRFRFVLDPLAVTMAVAGVRRLAAHRRGGRIEHGAGRIA